MKIRTRFTASAVIFVTLLCLISALMLAASQKVKRLRRQVEVAADIERSASLLRYTSNEYLRYQEGPQLRRWKSALASFSEDLSRLVVDRPEQQAILTYIQANQRRLQEVFAETISTLEAAQRAGKGPPDPRVIQLAWSRMSVQNQEMAFDALRLSRMLTTEEGRVQQTNLLLIFVLIGAFGAYILANFVLIYRRTLTSLAVLRAATRTVGSGNLDFAIAGMPNDELGDLSRAFNRMTVNLRSATASKAALEREMAERRQAEEELRRTADELARSNQDLEQFAYVASHDLKEPLRMVTGFMGLLQDHCRECRQPHADECIGFATNAAERMQGLIDDLLAYARVGRAEVAEPTSAAAAVDRALENLRAGIEESGARVTRDPLPTVVANSLELTQVFQNLIGNALKFRGEGPPEVHLGAAREEGRWVFSVRDNGIGIEPQYQDRLFVLFQRLHPRDRYPGSGVGLAICKKIVERHGGRIWLQSESGKGTTIFFCVPDRPEASREGREEAGKTAQP